MYVYKYNAVSCGFSWAGVLTATMRDAELIHSYYVQ